MSPWTKSDTAYVDTFDSSLTFVDLIHNWGLLTHIVHVHTWCVTMGSFHPVAASLSALTTWFTEQACWHVAVQRYVTLFVHVSMCTCCDVLWWYIHISKKDTDDMIINTEISTLYRLLWVCGERHHPSYNKGIQYTFTYIASCTSTKVHTQLQWTHVWWWCRTAYSQTCTLLRAWQLTECTSSE